MYKTIIVLQLWGFCHALREISLFSCLSPDIEFCSRILRAIDICSPLSIKSRWMGEEIPWSLCCTKDYLLSEGRKLPQYSTDKRLLSSWYQKGKRPLDKFAAVCFKENLLECISRCTADKMKSKHTALRDSQGYRYEAISVVMYYSLRLYRLYLENLTMLTRKNVGQFQWTSAHDPFQ